MPQRGLRSFLRDVDFPIARSSRRVVQCAAFTNPRLTMHCSDRSISARGILALLILLLSALFVPQPAAATWSFAEITESAGVSFVHGFDGEVDMHDVRAMAGGVAVGDYDADGWLDLYVVSGSAGRNYLFRNRGDGTFADVTVSTRVDLPGVDSSGPVFADIDGDGWLDLFVLANTVEGAEVPIRLFRNLGNGRFTNRTSATGIEFSGPTALSAAFSDIDRDGDLDLFITHWGSAADTPPAGMLWRNDGDFEFTDITAAAGIAYRFHPEMPGADWMFTPNFADIDSDGWPDLLLANDFGTSQVFLNDGDGTFTETTAAVIDDENGMGAAVVDYDNDGDLDWFVTSVSDPFGVQGDVPTIGDSGNRLYRNQGDGTFVDATDEAGVRHGDWGWAAAFGDLNLDGHPDLYMVNGMGQIEDGPEWAYFISDPARLWVSEGDGTFLERSVALGVADTGMGRGTVLFDFDRDGDLDIFNQNATQEPVFYRNDLDDGSHFLTLRLLDGGANREAVGARVRVTSGGTTQMRELHSGNGYVSANAIEAHFGLGTAETIDELEVQWPDGAVTTVADVDVDRHVLLRHPGAEPIDCSQPGDQNDCILGGKTRSPMECLMELHVTPVPERDRNGPTSRVVCTAGDPACDGNPADLTSCTIDVRLCPATSDPRNPICPAATLTDIVVRTPRATSKKPADLALRAAVDRLVGIGIASLVPPEGSPFENLLPGVCTAAESVVIPLRERAPGVYRKNRTRLKLRTYSSDGRRDLDKLVLTCLPSDA